MAETEQERSRRRRKRMLFDDIAPAYDASRLGYPDEIIDFVIGSAGLDSGSDVLEVGCGTGQLTQSLAGRGYQLAAIDIGPAMIAAARRRLAGAAVAFQVSSFEELAAPDGSFDLIIAGAAYHWVDPEVRFSKPARLLRPGGWLALAGYDERYDDPVGSALTDMWIARRGPGDQWAGPQDPADAEAIAASGRFGRPVMSTVSERLELPAEAVVRIESTRSTALNWAPETREQFLRELTERLSSQPAVPLTRVSWVTMAQIAPRP
jgi:ubiquinone/menaquinone biosynthesis C-methylase UbiE